MRADLSLRLPDGSHLPHGGRLLGAAGLLAAFPVVQMESLPTSRTLLPPKALLHINAKQLSSYGGSLDTAATDMVHYLTAGYGVLVLCGGKVRAENLQNLLRERGIGSALQLDGSLAPAKGQVIISLGSLSAGSEYPGLKLAILTEGQLMATQQKKAKLKKEKDSNRQKIQSYTDLSVGDLVVHVHHGVGRFAGIQRMPVDGVEKDYIKIDYAGGDCLYVPATALDQVSKYIGAEGTKLSKMGGAEWKRAKAKAKLSRTISSSKGAYC